MATDLYLASAAMYLRKSRAEELTDTTEEVLTRHRAILDELARKHGVVVEAVYEEVISGESIAKRPEMQRLLADVAERKYKAVLCMDIDRLGRGNMSDQGVLLEAFQLSNTLIVTPDKIYDLNDEIDEELTEFKAFFARREWKMIRKRMRRGLMQTIEAGGYIANEPYGYRKTRVGKPPNDLPTLEIVPEEAKFIAHIYSRYLSGTGAHIIAEELNAMGSHPRRSADWNRNTVRGILRNPTYKGYVAWNRVKHLKPGSAPGVDKNCVKYMPQEEWILVKGLHQGIISEADWEKAQDIRRGKKIYNAHYDGTCKSSLAGLMICGNCGRKMQRQAPKDDNARLICAYKGCMPGVRFDYVEEAVLNAIHTRLGGLELEAKRAAAQLNPADVELLAGIDRTRDKVQQRIQRTYTLLEEGVYDIETFRARKKTAEEELAKLDAQRTAIAERIALQETQDLSRAAADLQNVLDMWEQSDAAARNQLLKGIFKQITYYKEPKSPRRSFELEFEALHFLW